MKTCLRHYQRYYNSVKEDLKSDNTYLAIEKIAMSIERNMKYLRHYQSIDVTIFDFVGDSIVEAANCGLRRIS